MASNQYETRDAQDDARIVALLSAMLQVMQSDSGRTRGPEDGETMLPADLLDRLSRDRQPDGGGEDGKPSPPPTPWDWKAPPVSPPAEPPHYTPGPDSRSPSPSEPSALPLGAASRVATETAHPPLSPPEIPTIGAGGRAAAAEGGGGGGEGGEPPRGGGPGIGGFDSGGIIAVLQEILGVSGQTRDGVFAIGNGLAAAAAMAAHTGMGHGGAGMFGWTGAGTGGGGDYGGRPYSGGGGGGGGYRTSPDYAGPSGPAFETEVGRGIRAYPWTQTTAAAEALSRNASQIASHVIPNFREFAGKASQIATDAQSWMRPFFNNSPMSVLSERGRMADHLKKVASAYRASGVAGRPGAKAALNMAKRFRGSGRWAKTVSNAVPKFAVSTARRLLGLSALTTDATIAAGIASGVMATAGVAAVGAAAVGMLALGKEMTDTMRSSALSTMESRSKYAMGPLAGDMAHFGINEFLRTQKIAGDTYKSNSSLVGYADYIQDRMLSYDTAGVKIGNATAVGVLGFVEAYNKEILKPVSDLIDRMGDETTHRLARASGIALGDIMSGKAYDVLRGGPLGVAWDFYKAMTSPVPAGAGGIDTMGAWARSVSMMPFIPKIPVF